jgi:DNA-directed RNA polymerase subunit alpha
MNQQPFFEIKEETKKDNYSKFTISPLEQGYGSTLGNSLRRVLLTSLTGAAVVSVRISGVKHQFTTLKGMKEDIVEFLLNLKKVKFTYDSDKPTSATLVSTTEGEVKASDIKVDPNVTIVNPDQVLAVLNKGSKLDVKMDIQAGVGYSPAEERATGEIGFIPLDASFSPITRVNYKIEETRVGRLTNYDKLVMEIWTDGTIEPKDAIVRASNILVSYLNQIITPQKVEKVEDAKDEGIGPVGKLSVEEIGLPTRVANALLKAGYETVESVVKAKRDELVKVRNLGEKSVKIIEAALGEKNLSIQG